MMENMAHQYCPDFQMNIQLRINSHQAKKGLATPHPPGRRRGQTKQEQRLRSFPSLAILLNYILSAILT